MARAILRNGSSGEDVKVWQGVIGVTADGKFGPATEKATKIWQAERKLVADGIVGAASWAAAGEKSTPAVKAKTSSAPIDQQAYEIAKKADPNMSEKVRQYVLTVARGEGFYGQGWGKSVMNGSVTAKEENMKYGLTGLEGVGSNNWGAVQGKGDAGSFPHIDHRADGSPYVGNYRRWSTPEKGFLDVAKIILGGGLRKEAGAAAIKKAIESGSLKDAVFTQHANGYFELDPNKYLSAVQKNYDILTVNNEWKRLLDSNKGMIGTVVGIALAATIGVVGYRKFKT